MSAAGNTAHCSTSTGQNDMPASLSSRAHAASHPQLGTRGGGPQHSGTLTQLSESYADYSIGRMLELSIVVSLVL